jgi:hypothetical protein
MRKLRARAEELFERLLTVELELLHGPTFKRRMAAFYDFAELIDMIDDLNADAERREANVLLLKPLRRKVSSIMRSSKYRVLEWFHVYEEVRWYVARIDPVWLETPC